MATKKVVKKVAVPKKDKYIYMNEGDFYHHDSIADIEEDIKDYGYDDGTRVVIYKLVKVVKVVRTTVTLEEIK